VGQEKRFARDRITVKLNLSLIIAVFAAEGLELRQKWQQS
jgi:hypothetical protein